MPERGQESDMQPLQEADRCTALRDARGDRNVPAVSHAAIRYHANVTYETQDVWA
jgi:hypothetical protein